MTYRHRPYRFAAFVVLALWSVAACAKDLSRDEARKLLLAQKTYPEVLRSYIEIPVGTFWDCQPKRLAERDAVKRAVADGLLTFKITGKRRSDHVCYDYNRYEIVSELTEAGRALVAVTDEQAYDEDAAFVSFRACEVDFGEITGITMSDDGGQAYVEYTERYVRTTPWADDHNNGKCVEGTTFTRRARFRRYDDGWRLVSSG